MPRVHHQQVGEKPRQPRGVVLGRWRPLMSAAGRLSHGGAVSPAGAESRLEAPPPVGMAGPVYAPLRGPRLLHPQARPPPGLKSSPAVLLLHPAPTVPRGTAAALAGSCTRARDRRKRRGSAPMARLPVVQRCCGGALLGAVPTSASSELWSSVSEADWLSSTVAPPASPGLQGHPVWHRWRARRPPPPACGACPVSAGGPTQEPHPQPALHSALPGLWDLPPERARVLAAGAAARPSLRASAEAPCAAAAGSGEAALGWVPPASPGSAGGGPVGLAEDAIDEEGPWAVQ
jgi:hypothetical protein